MGLKEHLIRRTIFVNGIPLRWRQMEPPVGEIGIQLGQVLVLCKHNLGASHEAAKIADGGNAEGEGREGTVFTGEELVVKVLHI